MADTSQFSDSDIICPHCGKEATDPWEYDSGNYQCGWCECWFALGVSHYTTYTTTKITDPDKE